MNQFDRTQYKLDRYALQGGKMCDQYRSMNHRVRN